MHYESITLPGGARCTVASRAGGDEPSPLVVSLHYGGPVSPWYGRGLLEGVVAPALAELGAVFVAPDCTANQWADPIGVQAVNEAIGYASANFAIDAGRTLLTGYSKGGVGTWALAAMSPEKFQAAVVMAGRPPAGLNAAAWRVPTRVIHARNDELLPLSATEAWVRELEAAGAPVSLEILDGVTHFETHLFAEPLRGSMPWIREVFAG